MNHGLWYSPEQDFHQIHQREETALLGCGSVKCPTGTWGVGSLPHSRDWCATEEFAQVDTVLDHEKLASRNPKGTQGGARRQWIDTSKQKWSQVSTCVANIS